MMIAEGKEKKKEKEKEKNCNSGLIDEAKTESIDFSFRWVRKETFTTRNPP